MCTRIGRKKNCFFQLEMDVQAPLHNRTLGVTNTQLTTTLSLNCTFDNVIQFLQILLIFGMLDLHYADISNCIENSRSKMDDYAEDGGPEEV